MPLITSTYKSPAYMFHGHVETIYPYLLRSVPAPAFDRNRLELPDGDFIDLDWCRQHSERLLVLCHGLEGSSDSVYIKGMTRAAVRHGWDVLAINFRSCSGEINRNLRMYHHGEIEDLTFVLDQLLAEDKYGAISLCGFSLGGNVILKYLGTLGSKVPLAIRSAVAISVPCDLASSSQALDAWSNYLYTRRFRRSLKKKFAEKNKMFPGVLDLSDYEKVRSWQDFDNRYTTALTDFRNADEYYAQGSANNFLPGIRTSTLLLNAANDPFLTELSYPRDICVEHAYVYLEIPRDGGHVGFWYPGRKEAYMEERTLTFLDQYA